eukprot:644915-Rhodomonas_salina.1
MQSLGAPNEVHHSNSRTKPSPIPKNQTPNTQHATPNTQHATPYAVEQTVALTPQARMRNAKLTSACRVAVRGSEAGARPQGRRRLLSLPDSLLPGQHPSPPPQSGGVLARVKGSGCEGVQGSRLSVEGE